MIKSFKKVNATIHQNSVIFNWIFYYLVSRLKRRQSQESAQPIHIMLCLVDHFEPFHGGVDFQHAEQRVQTWQSAYPRLARHHHDSDGYPPQHTWFYPPHLDHRFLKNLVELCQDGYGEIEMHLHHNHQQPFPDTSATLKAKILSCIEDYSRYGIFCLPDRTKKFAFIHGDWSLDNALGPTICGINDEIQILKACGCFADFTFPCIGKAQPRTINKFYYVQDDPLTPKSYNRGVEVRVGGYNWGDLLMIQGILGIRWRKGAGIKKISLEASDLDGSISPDNDRIEFWINNAVSIQGKPEWKFIKLHVHGAEEHSWSNLLFEGASRMYNYLETKYNDQQRCFLHYVTAREMYNIVKAAEAGETGNPHYFRDYIVPGYIYSHRR